MTLTANACNSGWPCVWETIVFEGVKYNAIMSDTKTNKLFCRIPFDFVQIPIPLIIRKVYKGT